MPVTNCTFKRANIYSPLSVEILVLGFCEKDQCLVNISLFYLSHLFTYRTLKRLEYFQHILNFGQAFHVLLAWGNFLLVLVNPLSGKCDQHQISPCNINNAL